MKQIIIIFFLIISFSLISQTRIYHGYLGKNQIELLTFSYSDGVVNAIYSYSNFDTPIEINGHEINNKLVLNEKNERKLKAQLKFDNYEPSDINLIGKWIDSENSKEYDIKLTKVKEFSSYDKSEIIDLELLQRESTDVHYFKTIINKDFKEMPKVTGLKVYEKKTDKLLQSLELYCDYRYFNSVYVGDYNFDKLEEFSIFEFFYAGPNTSSIYFLFNPKNKKYENSGFEGTSLEFDNENKLVYEHNQCCAGAGHMNATYKIINNKMVLIEKKCIEYNNEKEDFEEVKCN